MNTDPSLVRKVYEETREGFRIFATLTRFGDLAVFVHLPIVGMICWQGDNVIRAREYVDGVMGGEAMNADALRIARIRELAIVAKTAEWGSDEQIEAENGAVALALDLGLDVDYGSKYDSWCLKATVDERMGRLLEMLPK